MQAKKLDATVDELMDPLSARWRRVRQETVALQGTPVQLQPSRYVRAKWSDRPTGTVRSLGVRAAHDGRRIYFQLEWRDATEDRAHGERGFPDAAGVLFPLNGAARLQTMGSPDEPVNAWYWRADADAARNLVASGLGTVDDAADGRLTARSAWKAGVWRLVLSRSLQAPRQSAGVRLRAGRPVSVAFAVWEGANGERGGLKAVTNDWQDLSLQA